jgi:preprotein translocase subunit SecD
MIKSYRWKLLLLVAMVAVSIYALLPTFEYYGRPEAARNDPRDPEMKDLRSKALKLGLDLKGGMHLALELDRSKLPSEASSRDAVDERWRSCGIGSISSGSPSR